MNFSGEKNSILIKRIPIKEFKNENGEYFICSQYELVKSLEQINIDGKWIQKERYFICLTDGISTSEVETIKYSKNSSNNWVNFDDDKFDFGLIWIPQYETSVSLFFNREEITNGLIKTYAPRGIRQTYREFTLNFSSLEDIETKSLIAFNEFFETNLNIFLFTPPAPYSKVSFYKITGFSHTENSFNDNSIQITITETFSFPQRREEITHILESYLA